MMYPANLARMIPTLAGLTLELVPHCASVRPADWPGDPIARPLAETGHRQAVDLATRIGTDVVAIWSSPMLRCIQTVRPLARAAGLPVEQLPELRDTQDFAEPRTWKHGILAPVAEPVAGAWAAGRGIRALLTIAEHHPGGRVVAASHGDLIPVLLSTLCAIYAVPPPSATPDRGGWWNLHFTPTALTITPRAPLLDEKRDGQQARCP
jgi:broad specificity phosphatase PhoE